MFDCALYVTCVEPLSAQPLSFLVVDASCSTWSVEFPRLTRGPLLLASPYLLDGQHFTVRSAVILTWYAVATMLMLLCVSYVL